jgi:hypothetical protein
MITVGKTKDVRFVLKARGVLKFEYILVKDKWMYATDGTRMHAAETHTPDGVYTVIEGKDEIVLTPSDATFPNVTAIERLCPVEDKEKTHHFMPCRDKILNTRAISKAIAAINKSIAGYVNIESMKDVLSDSFDIYVYGDTAPMFFKNHSKRAYVMPCVLE